MRDSFCIALAATAPTSASSSLFKVCPACDFFIAACTLGSFVSTGTAPAAPAAPADPAAG